MCDMFWLLCAHTGHSWRNILISATGTSPHFIPVRGMSLFSALWEGQLIFGPGGRDKSVFGPLLIFDPCGRYKLIFGPCG